LGESALCNAVGVGTVLSQVPIKILFYMAPLTLTRFALC